MSSSPNNNLVDLLAPYAERQLWVALNEERTRVVGSGERAVDALRKAKRNQVGEPFLVKAVPDFSRFMLS